MGFRYLKSQLKRVSKLIPGVLLAYICLLAGVAVLFSAIYTHHDSDESHMEIQIGCVGSLNDYMGINLDEMVSTIAGEYGVTLVPMTEKEAERKVFNNEIQTYIKLPEGFVDAVDSGRNDLKIIYVTASHDKSLGNQVLDEIVVSFSDIMTSTQAIYDATYERAKGAGLSHKPYYRALDDKMARAMFSLLALIEFKETGISNGTSFRGYFFVSIYMIFISLSTLGAVVYFTGRNDEFEIRCASAGVSVGTQVMSEFCAYLTMQLSGLLLYTILVAATLKSGVLSVMELDSSPVLGTVSFVIRSLPVAFMICAFQFLVYELAPKMIPALLSQFMLAVGIGYISGYYYPESFFPKAMTAITMKLPGGWGLKYCISLLNGQVKAGYLLLLVPFTVLLLGAAVFSRNKRLFSK